MKSKLVNLINVLAFLIAITACIAALLVDKRYILISLSISIIGYYVSDIKKINNVEEKQNQ